MHIKVNDVVQVVSGGERGTADAPVRGKVLKVDLEKRKVLVEGVNSALKHIKRSQKNPQGGRLKKEMPIAISNVMLICPQTGKPTRVGVRYLADGSKERYSKKSGASMGVISPPREKYAKKK